MYSRTFSKDIKYRFYFIVLLYRNFNKICLTQLVLFFAHFQPSASCYYSVMIGPVRIIYKNQHERAYRQSVVIPERSQSCKSLLILPGTTLHILLADWWTFAAQRCRCYSLPECAIDSYIYPAECRGWRRVSRLRCTGFVFPHKRRCAHNFVSTQSKSLLMP